MLGDCLISGQGHEIGTFKKNKILGETNCNTTRQDSKISREPSGRFRVSVILHQQWL